MCRRYNILIIGGTGVISSAVVSEALNRGIDVTIVTRGRRKIPTGVNSILCDKNNYIKLSEFLKGKRFDAVIDFLCFTVDDLDKSFTFFSKYTDQYFFISSCAVYDKRQGGVLSEEAPKVLPMWEYSVNKWNAEQRLMKLAKDTNCAYTIIRPAITYDNTRIPYGISPQYGYHWTLCARILAGKPIITWNNGENRTNMMRVEDFAVGLVGLIGNEKAYNEAFNICGDETPSFRDVLSVVEKYIQKKIITIDIPSVFYAKQIPYRAGELIGGRSNDAFNSNAKIKEVVPEFKQRITLKEGVFKTLDAYKAQNYQHGIDWKFDAETDKTIREWCKKNGIPRKKYKWGFVDYLGNATWHDKYAYYEAANPNALWIKAIGKLKKIFNRRHKWGLFK